MNSGKGVQERVNSVVLTYTSAEHVDGLWREAAPTQRRQREEARVVPVPATHHSTVLARRSSANSVL